MYHLLLLTINLAHSEKQKLMNGEKISIVSELERYLHLDPRMSLVRIVMDYYSLLGFLWEEQKLSAEEMAKSELFLARLTVNRADYWEINPWYVGEGATLVKWLLATFWCQENICDAFDFPNTTLDTSGVLGTFSDAKRICLFEDHSDFNLIDLYCFISREMVRINDILYDPRVQIYPPGVGIFRKYPFQQPIEFGADAIERRIVQFDLNYPSSLSQFQGLDLLFLEEEAKKFWQTIRTTYLPFVKQHADQNVRKLFSLLNRESTATLPA